MASKGKFLSEEHKKKISLAHIGMKKFWITGEKSGKWKGNKVGYWGIHDWLQKEFGKANKCENPNCFKKSRVFNWAKLENKLYERRRENFIMLCRSCHAKYDGFRPPKVEKLSEEHKKKLSIAHTGKKLSKETKIKLSKALLDYHYNKKSLYK